MQSKKRSRREAWVNIAIGYSINWCLNIILMPYLWHKEHPMLSAHAIGIVYTLISFTRQYIIRRRFTKGDAIEQ